jgi:hypothetical protein
MMMKNQQQQWTTTMKNNNTDSPQDEEPTIHISTFCQTKPTIQPSFHLCIHMYSHCSFWTWMVESCAIEYVMTTIKSLLQNTIIDHAQPTLPKYRHCSSNWLCADFLEYCLFGFQLLFGRVCVVDVGQTQKTAKQLTCFSPPISTRPRPTKQRLFYLRGAQGKCLAIPTKDQNTIVFFRANHSIEYGRNFHYGRIRRIPFSWMILRTNKCTLGNFHSIRFIIHHRWMEDKPCIHMMIL